MVKRMLGSSSTSNTLGIVKSHYDCRVGTVPSAVAPGQRHAGCVYLAFDPALPRSVLCLPGSSAIVHVLSFLDFDRGKLDDEACEFSFFAFNLNRAAEIANDAEADTQAQPGAARLAPRRKKRIEHFAEIFAFDPDSVVVKLHAYILPCPACTDSK